jgi:UDP-glucose 4-epimerase
MSSINNKKFLLVGGAGFIGSHLGDTLLKQGAKEVVVIDNFFLGKRENLIFAQKNYKSAFTLYSQDACDQKELSKIIENHRPDVVINLATKALLHSFMDPADAFRVNTDITLNLLESLRLSQYERLVHISTSEVFGTALVVPMNEDHYRRPETSYAAGKASADLAIESYINMYNLNALILRPFNNYGPRQNTESLAAIIPKTVKRITQGLPPIIEGDGLQTRDFIYVEDTVNLILQFIEKKDLVEWEFNLGSGQETTIMEIIKGICNVMSYQGEILYHPERTADVRRHRADVSRAELAIGKFNLTSLQEGLDKTINWYNQALSES